MENNIIHRVLSSIKTKRQNILSGNINSIPSPFKRFSNSFIGIQRSKLYLITAQSKASKTQFASYTFIYTPILYAYHNPDKVKLKIFYFPLEESPERVILRYMSFLLYYLSDFKYQVDPETLLSSNNIALPQNIIDILESERYMNYLNFFNSVVQFSSTTNVTGIYKEVKSYIEDRGTTYTRKVPIKGEHGNLEYVDKFDYYVPHDEKEYVMYLVDHVGELTLERGFTKKENIDKLGDYGIELRNNYSATGILIQQQLVNESIDNFKLDKLRPTNTNLQDTKYLYQKANMVLGIFSPLKYGLEMYLGYHVKYLKDNIRFVEIMANRDGLSNDIVALYFNGATCYFEELPKPDDPKIEGIYEKSRAKKQYLLTHFLKNQNGKFSSYIRCFRTWKIKFYSHFRSRKNSSI